MLLKKRILALIFMFLLGLLVPAGWVFALPAASSLPSLSANQPRLGLPCIGTRQVNSTLNAPTGSLPGDAQAHTIPLTGTTTIGDFVWYDVNGNGIQDEGEPGVEDVVCVLCRFGEDVPVATTTTDANGFYSFKLTDTLRMGGSGSYYVVFGQPNGYTFTTPDVNGNDHDDQDSDVITSTIPNIGQTDYFTLTPGVHDSWDAGLISVEERDLALSELNSGSLTPTLTASAAARTSTPTKRAQVEQKALPFGSDLDVEPASLSSTQAPDTVLTQTLTFTNTASATLDWTLQEGAGASCPSDIPWAAASPDMGTLQPEMSEQISVSFDSTGLATGTYTGTLCLVSTSPPQVTVPLTLNVTNGPSPTPTMTPTSTAIVTMTLTPTPTLTNTPTSSPTSTPTASITP
ncbi:MAG: SdrD B-like domain-containing protein, partial [Ardenticatenaceae bacterium]